LKGLSCNNIKVSF